MQAIHDDPELIEEEFFEELEAKFLRNHSQADLLVLRQECGDELGLLAQEGVN